MKLKQVRRKTLKNIYNTYSDIEKCYMKWFILEMCLNNSQSIACK